MKTTMLTMMTLVIGIQTQQPTIQDLQAKIVRLENRVLSLEQKAPLWNEGIATERGLFSGEQRLLDDFIKLKKKVQECCPWN